MNGVSGRRQPRIEAVIPTIPGREQSLGRLIDSLEEHGLDWVIVEESPSCGEGWELGLDRTTADFVLLASDDFVLVDWSARKVVLDRADATQVVCPVIYEPDGTLQGAGGMGQRLDDGDVAVNCIAPFARRDVLETYRPWPHLNHYCDTWITCQARLRNRGPIVTHGFAFTHHYLSEWNPGEYEAYTEWRTAHERV
jgi:hypothetical protein